MEQVGSVIRTEAAPQPHVYIILLNWNGWSDTIECLESVFRLDYPSFNIIVCDNGSTDGSMEKIQDWARGNLKATCTSPDLSRLIVPPLSKPIKFVAITGSEVAKVKPPADVRLVLIQTGANQGFAKGNNVGIRYAFAQGHRGYVWLLNNDTVVEPDALSALVKVSQDNPTLGICGSLLRYYVPPHDVQSLGRQYTPWSGRTHPFSGLASSQNNVVPSGLGYIVEGASMLVSGSFLEKVGLLEESYFLFFEELDWITRGRPDFLCGFSPTSVVYHKVGASIGSSTQRSSRSVLSDFYQARSRILFTRRYYPWFLPSVFAAVIAGVLQRVVIGRPENARAILRGAIATFTRTRSDGQAFGRQPINANRESLQDSDG